MTGAKEHAYELKYRGPNRRHNPEEDAFVRAVTEATQAATQSVAKIHRVRLVVQSGIVAFGIAALVALVAVLAVSDSQHSYARRQATYNCGLVVGLTKAMTDFIRSDARVRTQQQKDAISQQITKDFGKLLPAKDLAAAVKDSAQINAQTVNYWETNIVPRLEVLAAANCAALARG